MRNQLLLRGLRQHCKRRVPVRESEVINGKGGLANPSSLAQYLHSSRVRVYRNQGARAKRYGTKTA